MTKGRLLAMFVLNLVGVFSQMLAAGAFLAVIQYGNPVDNFALKTIYSLIDASGLRGDKEILGFLLLFATFAYFLSSGILLYSMIYTARLQSIVYLEIQPVVVEKLIDSDYEFILSQNSGKLNNIIVQQIRVVAQSFKLYVDIVQSIIFAIFYIGTAFLIDPVLSLIMLVAGIPFMGLAKVANRKSRDISLQNVNEVSRLNSVIIQMIAHLKYLKSTGTSSAVIKKLISSSREIAHLVVRLAIWSGITSYGITPFAVALIAGLVYWQIAFMKAPVLTALSTLAFLYAASQKLITIPASYQKFLSSSGSILIYNEFLDELEKNREKDHGQNAMAPDFAGSLEFKDVSFSYRTGKDKVLRNIDISIKPKSSVAFVGGSGAGKSTIVNLITGLLSPKSGKMVLSGVEYDRLDLDKLRKGVGYVTQEAVIFNDTVKNNITLWEDGIPANVTVENSAQMSCADDFITQMKNSYDSLLGDSGANISGGQRQRISIARELFRDTEILILDEATSALDSETEQSIHKNIEKLKGSKTLVIIAHRLSTVKGCDVIYVLDKGEIVEQGKYAELYARNGKFREMVDRQSLSES